MDGGGKWPAIKLIAPISPAALLQHAILMVFGESFAALDPENLEHAIECVIERAPSLIAIPIRKFGNTVLIPITYRDSNN